MLCALAFGACGGEAPHGSALPDSASLTAANARAPALTLDRAATAHAAYQQRHQQTTHDEVAGNAGFTGRHATDRLLAAGVVREEVAADGELIAATRAADGFAVAEALLTAIYHRYLLLEPVFDAAGAGAAGTEGGKHWLTIHLMLSARNAPLSPSTLAVWPAPGQSDVRPVFFSDQESPDPIPDRDAVGYPVSVHAPLGAVLSVQEFIVHSPTGAAVPVRVLSAESDSATPPSAAAVIPLAPLESSASYAVRFRGTLNGQSVQRTWSFATR